jgi:hypothetical protein
VGRKCPTSSLCTGGHPWPPLAAPRQKLRGRQSGLVNVRFGCKWAFQLRDPNTQLKYKLPSRWLPAELAPLSNQSPSPGADLPNGLWAGHYRPHRPRICTKIAIFVARMGAPSAPARWLRGHPGFAQAEVTKNTRSVGSDSARPQQPVFNESGSNPVLSECFGHATKPRQYFSRC